MSSYIPDLTRDNLSFYTVPAAFVLVFMPLFYKVSTYQAATKRLPDALQPRDFCGSVREDQSLDQKTKGRLLRADGAHNNGFENLGVFAAGVVAMNMARLSPATMNGLSIGYCVSRLVYNHVYIFNDLVHPYFRTAVFFSGVGCTMAMWIMAGNDLRRSLLV